MGVLKKIIILILLALIIFAIMIVGMFYGNPISKVLAKNSAKSYLAENYADADFYVDGVGYNFKDGRYYVYVSSESSGDSSFSLEFNQHGKLIADYYDTCVTERGNTQRRIRDEYRANVEKLLYSKDFPYKVDIGFGDIEICSLKEAEEYSVPDYVLISDDLILDALYDVNELGAKAGHLTIYIDDEIVTCERLSEILLNIKRVFDDAGVRFYIIDCVLESSHSDDRVEVMHFLYSDIYEDGMEERVSVSDKAAKDYYEMQDSIKSEENGI